MTQEDQIKGTGDTELQFVEHFGLAKSPEQVIFPKQVGKQNSECRPMDSKGLRGHYHEQGVQPI